MVLKKMKELFMDEIKEVKDAISNAREDLEEGKLNPQIAEALEKDVEEFYNYTGPDKPEWLEDVYLIGLAWRWYVNKPDTPTFVEVEEDNRGKLRYIIHYDAIERHLLKKFCVIRYVTLWIWNGRQFIENKGELEAEIKRILQSYGITDEKKIQSIINEIMFRLNYTNFVRDYPFNPFKVIPCKNGVFVPGHGLYPHSPGFLNSFCINANYDPNAKCPKIEKFISEVVHEKDQQILYEIPALAIMQANDKFQVSYMLVGSGSNGKSTYLRLITTFLGPQNVSNIALQELTDRFRPAQIVGKLANIYADIPSKPIKYTGMFKMLTGGDRITLEKKYKDPFEYTNKAVFVFSANELPEVNDNTYAFWRRWIVVQFPKKFNKNPNLINELTTEEELSGFLNKVIHTMNMIELKGEVTRTDEVEKIMEEWFCRSNPVYAFVKHCIEKNSDFITSKDSVYDAYVCFCNLHNYNVLAKNKFAMELQRHVLIRPTRPKIGGERVMAWQGIKLKCYECDEECEMKDRPIVGVGYNQTKLDDDDWSLDEVLS